MTDPQDPTPAPRADPPPPPQLDAQAAAQAYARNMPYGYAPQPNYGYPQPADPERRGLSGGALAAIIGGGILGLIVIGLVIGFAVISQIANAQREAAARPGQVVEKYLNAVADSDAAAALSYIAEPPADGPLLTDEALAFSEELAPITDIAVGQSDGDPMSVTVPVTYMMGGESVSTQYDVVDYDRDGEWELTAGTATLEVSRYGGLGLTVNDQPVDADTVDVFPGTYALVTTLDNFTLSGPPTVAATDPFMIVDTADIEPALSETGLALFRQTVRTAVEACVASTALEAGCGLTLPATLDDGTQLVDGTIARSLEDDTVDTLDSLEAFVGSDTPTVVDSGYIGSVNVSADCSQNGQTGRCELIFTPSLGVAYVDMASAQPTVEWE